MSRPKYLTESTPMNNESVSVVRLIPAPRVTRREESPDYLFKIQVRTVVNGKVRPITIYAFDRNEVGRLGHHSIDIEVTHCGDIVFHRGDLRCAVNQWTAIDSDDAKGLVMSTVGMKPGDTDMEYFANYTPEQCEFVEKYADDIIMAKYDRYGER